VCIEGNTVNSRGGTQKEILFCNFCIEDPTALDIAIPSRNFSIDYAITEWAWYLSGDKNVKNIGKMAKIWKNIADDNGEVESNYGVYLVEQWKWIIHEILNDNDTRRATITINEPYHKYKNKKDYPCTQYIQFFVRDQKLHLGVNMRSNDIIFGMCNDVFTFCLFQQLMLNELNSKGMNLSLGNYYHQAGSMHLYKRHFSMSRSILEDIKNGYNYSNVSYDLREGVTWETLYEKVEFLLQDQIKENVVKNIQIMKKEIFNEHS